MTKQPRPQSAPRPQAAAAGKPRRLVTHLWRQWLRPIAPIVLIALTFRGAVADWNDVPSGSMKPTILEGDRIFVNKLAYGLRVPLTTTWIAQWGQPARGEIVVLFSPTDGKRLVKRVIGLPGDLIAMRNNRLYLNGQPTEYGPADDATIAQLTAMAQRPQIVATEMLGRRAHPVMATPSIPAPRTFEPIEVPPGHYFVMGDNRDCSADSRRFGFVPRKLIVGCSDHVVLSFDLNNWYWPRWDRTWHSLP